MDLVENILDRHFPNRRWIIEKPIAGLSKESYVVTSEEGKLFVKFDVDTPALLRLAEIGVTPPILIASIVNGRPYIIQKFVDGIYPDREWFSQNLPTLSRFIKTYQNDKELRKILKEDPSKSYQNHLDDELKVLSQSANDDRSELFRTNEFNESFTTLHREAAKLVSVSLVPVHADPNYKNILLTKQGIKMIDWDDILLSDPMRDVGLILWWYVRRNDWPKFFACYGGVMDEEKICWWVAKRSLAIALWFSARKDGNEATEFLRDFHFAISKKVNPQIEK